MHDPAVGGLGHGHMLGDEARIAELIDGSPQRVAWPGLETTGEPTGRRPATVTPGMNTENNPGMDHRQAFAPVELDQWAYQPVAQAWPVAWSNNPSSANIRR